MTIQEAYSVLSDPARRRNYDNKLLANRQKWNERRSVAPLGGTDRREAEPLIPEGGPTNLGTASLARSFNNYGPSFDALFDRIMSNFSGERPKAEMLENLTVEITLTPQQAFEGGHVRLFVPAKLRCPYC